MVRFCQGTLGRGLILIRWWCSFLPTCSDSVCSAEALVLPLPHLSSYSVDQHDSSHHRFSTGKTRRYHHSGDSCRKRLTVFRPVCLAQIGISSEPKQTNERSHFRQIFALKDVHLLASFILFYVGAEVTMGGKTDHPSCLYAVFLIYETKPRMDRYLYHRR